MQLAAADNMSAVAADSELPSPNHLQQHCAHFTALAPNSPRDGEMSPKRNRDGHSKTHGTNGPSSPCGMTSLIHQRVVTLLDLAEPSRTAPTSTSQGWALSLTNISSSQKVNANWGARDAPSSDVS